MWRKFPALLAEIEAAERERQHPPTYILVVTGSQYKAGTIVRITKRLHALGRERGMTFHVVDARPEFNPLQGGELAAALYDEIGSKPMLWPATPFWSADYRNKRGRR